MAAILVRGGALRGELTRDSLFPLQTNPVFSHMQTGRARGLLSVHGGA